MSRGFTQGLPMAESSSGEEEALRQTENHPSGSGAEPGDKKQVRNFPKEPIAQYILSGPMCLRLRCSGGMELAGPPHRARSQPLATAALLHNLGQATSPSPGFLKDQRAQSSPLSG